MPRRKSSLLAERLRAEPKRDNGRPNLLRVVIPDVVEQDLEIDALRPAVPEPGDVYRNQQEEQPVSDRRTDKRTKVDDPPARALAKLRVVLQQSSVRLGLSLHGDLFRANLLNPLLRDKAPLGHRHVAVILQPGQFQLVLVVLLGLEEVQQLRQATRCKPK